MPKSPTQNELDTPVLDHLRRDFVALRTDQTVAQTLDYLRSRSLGEKVVYFYVVDDAERLIGVLPTRRLLMSPPDARIENLMERRILTVPHTANLLLACELFVMHRLLAFPVIDDDNRLLGIVDVSLFTDEVFDLTQRQASDDVFQLIGVRLAQSRTHAPLRSFRERFPWLLCNVAGGIGCALIAGRYEAFLESVVVLALFIPVVLTLAESVSMQSMTLALQSMHQQRIDWRFLLAAIRREVLTAALLGGAAGLLVALIAFAWKATALVAAAVGAAILFAVITACLLGVFLPTGLRLLRGDPRIAAGPVVLAIADIATMLLYFNLAGLFLGHPARP